MRPGLQQEIRNITEVFSGSDGGVRYMKFRAAMEAIDQQAANGNEAASEIIEIVRRFSVLIDATTIKDFHYEYHERREG
jgi:hypothetical protein